MRANLEAGARSRFRTRTKVVATVLVVGLLVASCASFAWILVGQYLGLEQRIVADSKGAVATILIEGTADRAEVQVYMARGVGDVAARQVVCGVVVPELSAAGIHPAQVLVYSSNIRLIASGSNICLAPTPTAPPTPPSSPVPVSGNQQRS